MQCAQSGPALGDIIPQERALKSSTSGFKYPSMFASAAAPHRNSVPMMAEDLIRSWEAGVGDGVTGWVTRKNVDMPAPMQVNLFEFNADYPNLAIWGDISAVDGLNLNGTMARVGRGCGKSPDWRTGVTMPGRLMTNIEP